VQIVGDDLLVRTRARQQAPACPFLTFSPPLLA
jgi:hypothetical protein